MTGWFIWALLGGIVVFILLQHIQYRQNILMISILGLLLGWRGIDFSDSFVIYPTELFIWVGFVVYLMDNLTKRNTKKNKKYTGANFFEIALALLAITGAGTALSFGRSFLDVLFPLKSFLVFIPMLVLFRNWIEDKQQIAFYARTLVYVGVIISVLGLLERYIPQIAGLIPIYTPGSSVEIRYNFEFGSRIELAGFSAWGTPVVSTLLVMCAGLASLMPAPDNGRQKYILFFSFPILVLGIIAAGYRSSWLGLIVILFLLAFYNRPKLFSWSVYLVSGIIFLFSSVYLDRLKTLSFISNPQDPSFIRRSLALQNGWEAIINHPILGTGWGSPTAFNDWANIGVSMGLPGLFVFAGGYVWLLYRLFQYAAKAKEQNEQFLHLAFAGALLGYAIAMVSGAMSQVFPIMTGFWFVFCLSYRLVEISSYEEQKTNG